MGKGIYVRFGDDKKEERFVMNGLKKLYEKHDGFYFDLNDPETEREQAKTNLITTRMVIGSLFLVGLIVWFFVFMFSIKPEPITIIDTQIVTGNTYEVILDTNKLPAIGDMVYYYDETISVQSGAKLNQIRVDADGIIRYNICLQQEVGCNDEYDEDYYGECKTPIYEWNNCFDTSIIGSTEAELREGMCKD